MKRWQKVIVFLLVITLCAPKVRAEETELKKSTTLTLSFAGDCTLGYDYTSAYGNSFLNVYNNQEGNTTYFFENVLPIFSNDNITVVNLEGPLTDSEMREDKEFAFKGLPAFANILKEGSVEAANLANNHTMDYFKVGYDDTVSNIEQAGVTTFGGNKQAIIETNGVKTGLLGYKGWGDDTAIRNQITNDIASLRQQGADIVVVTFHWGEELSNYPNQIQKNLGHHAVDAGADLVIGHHPHVIQGIEVYQNTCIVYSLGNFCFGGNRNPKDKDTFIFQVEFSEVSSEKKGTYSIYPTKVSSIKERNDFKPTPQSGDEALRIMERLITYSEPLGTNRSFFENAYKNANANIVRHELENISAKNVLTP